LTASTVNGKEKRVRSGAQTLTLLSSHRNCLILRALAEGPKRQIELRRAAGSPAQTTLRAHLRALEDAGAITKQRRNAFPGALEYELEKPGGDLLAVASVLERWLADAPGGSLAPSHDAAKAAVKALVGGWSTPILRALAARPVSLTELDKVVAELNYPSLERRLTAMRLAGLVEALPANGRGTPYAATDWTRQAVAPIAAAIHWERRNAPDRTPAIGHLEAETGLLLAIPLLQLPTDLSGECRMAVEIPNGAEPRLAGVTVDVRAGRIDGLTSRLGGKPNAWASGSAAAWLRTVIEADSDSLELGGDCALALALLEGLHRRLFGRSLRTPNVSKEN
jgi:DNA-binding HxlR family transcriptional regulator